MSQNLSSAAVVIDPLRVTSLHAGKFFMLFCRLLVFFKINLFQMFFQEYHQTVNRERSGSVVECLTRDRGVAGSSLTGVTALWFLSKTHLS